jgi:hypothetical protein
MKEMIDHFKEELQKKDKKNDALEAELKENRIRS